MIKFLFGIQFFCLLFLCSSEAQNGVICKICGKWKYVLFIDKESDTDTTCTIVKDTTHNLEFFSNGIFINRDQDNFFKGKWFLDNTHSMLALIYFNNEGIIDTSVKIIYDWTMESIGNDTLKLGHWGRESYGIFIYKKIIDN